MMNKLVREDNYTHEEYKAKLAQLEEMMQSSEEEPDYVIDSVYQIYKALIENEQFYDIEIDRPIFAKKLIRCYRYVSNSFLDTNEVERIVIGGLYTMVDMCLMPKKLVDEATHKNPLGNIPDPEAFGLPSHELVNYGTRKVINNNLVVAVAYGSWADGEITLASHYDYITLH